MLIDLWRPTREEKQTLPFACRVFSEQRYKARRFLFTNEVMQSLGNLIRDYPEVLLDNLQFALPPYETCYVEGNIDIFLTALGSATTAMTDPSHAADDCIAYLIHDGIISSMFATIRMDDIRNLDGRPYLGQPMVSGIHYLIDDRAPPRGLIPIGKPDVQRSFWVAHLLGSTVHSKRLTQDQAQYVMNKYSAYVDEKLSDRAGNASLIKIIRACVGDVRNLLSLLLWLASPATYASSFQPLSSKLNNLGRKVNFLAHHVVHLKQPLSTRQLYRIMRPRTPPRRHEVAAFWRNHNKTNCVHEWPIYPDEKGHWHCAKCPQWRHRIESHSRGDARLGIITKEYHADKPGSVGT